MAKTSSTRTKKPAGGQAKQPKQDSESSSWGFEAIPDALRDAGRRASDLAQNPYARSLLAAGLVTAAAALAANKNVRDATKRNIKAATDAAEVGAENAAKIGTAIIDAATEAVQRLIALGGLAGAAGEAATGTGSSRARKASGTGGRAKKASSGSSRTASRAKTGSTRKPAAAKSGNGATRSSAKSGGTASKASGRSGASKTGTARKSSSSRSGSASRGRKPSTPAPETKPS